MYDTISIFDMPRIIFEVPFVHEQTGERRIVISELSLPEVEEALLGRFSSVDNPLSRRRASDRASMNLPPEFQRGLDIAGIRMIALH